MTREEIMAVCDSDSVLYQFLLYSAKNHFKTLSEYLVKPSEVPKVMKSIIDNLQADLEMIEEICTIDPIMEKDPLKDLIDLDKLTSPHILDDLISRQEFRHDSSR